MKTLVALTTAVLILAGCSAPAAPANTETEQTDGAVTLVKHDAPLELTVAAPSGPIIGDTWEASGTVGREAQLYYGIRDVMDGTGDPIIADGTWTLQVPVWPGLNEIYIAASDGENVERMDVDINVLAPVTVQVNYGPGGPAPADDVVMVDLVNWAARESYEEGGHNRPDFANAHDAMATWETEFSHAVDYSYSASFNSFGVDSIDGAGNALGAGAGPYWCYDINGEQAGVGISLQKIAAGDVLAWYFCGT